MTWREKLGPDWLDEHPIHEWMPYVVITYLMTDLIGTHSKFAAHAASAEPVPSVNHRRRIRRSTGAHPQAGTFGRVIGRAKALG